MLTLSRRTNQSITIGGNIVITVNRIGGNQVRLSVVAPRELEILRTELIKERTDAPTTDGQS